MRPRIGSRVGAAKSGPSRDLAVAVRMGSMRFHCLGPCRAWLFGADSCDWENLDDDGRAEQVKANPLRQVYRLTCGGHEIYAKFFRAPTVVDRVKWAVSGPPSRVEFERLRTARERSVAGPEPLAWASGVGGGKPVGILITRSLGAAVSLEEVLWQDEAAAKVGSEVDIDEALRAAGELTAHLHCGGIEHGDLHPGNILLTGEGAEGGMKAWITDLQNSRIEQRSGHASADPARRDRLANLAVLLAAIRMRTSADQQQRFIDSYLQEIHPYSHWSHRDMSDYGPRLYEYADRHHRRMLASRDRRCFRNTKYGRRIKLGDGWSGRVFLSAKHGLADSAASQQQFTRQDWQQALSDPAALVRGPEVLKEGSKATVSAGPLTVGGIELQVVFKHARRRSGVRGIVDAIRLSRAMRQWHGAHALINRQLPTAWPLAALEHHRFGFLVESVLITERIGEAASLHWLLRHGGVPAKGVQRKALAESLGRLIAGIGLQGMRHRDCKLSNIVIRHCPDGGWRPYLVDLDGLSVRLFGMGGKPHEALIRAAGSEPQRFQPPLRDMVRVFWAYLEELGAEERHNALLRRQLWQFVEAGAKVARANTRRDPAKVKAELEEAARANSVESG